MSKEELKELIVAIRGLTASIEDFAFEFSTSNAPADTANLIEALAELTKVVEATSGIGDAPCDSGALAKSCGDADGWH